MTLHIIQASFMFWHQSKTRMGFPVGCWSSVVTLVLYVAPLQTYYSFRTPKATFHFYTLIPAKISGVPFGVDP